jgi:spermidine synthase
MAMRESDLWELLGRAPIPGDEEMTLMRRGSEYVLLAGGKNLMSSRMHGSEEGFATIGCARARLLETPRVLIGGLGMGYTLRAALDALPADATVVQAELVPGVVDWNRGPLADLAGRPLEDRRVVVEVGDVAEVLRAGVGRYDAVLLDVDNGPRAFSQSGNGALYGDAGLAMIGAALRPGGVLAVWSAFADRKFEHRMRYAGFEVETHGVPARLRGGGPLHTIFVGLNPAAENQRPSAHPATATGAPRDRRR